MKRETLCWFHSPPQAAIYFFLRCTFSSSFERFDYLFHFIRRLRFHEVPIFIMLISLLICRHFHSAFSRVRLRFSREYYHEHFIYYFSRFSSSLSLRQRRRAAERTFSFVIMRSFRITFLVSSRYDYFISQESLFHGECSHSLIDFIDFFASLLLLSFHYHFIIISSSHFLHFAIDRDIIFIAFLFSRLLSFSSLLFSSSFHFRHYHFISSFHHIHNISLYWSLLFHILFFAFISTLFIFLLFSLFIFIIIIIFLHFQYYFSLIFFFADYSYFYFHIIISFSSFPRDIIFIIIFRCYFDYFLHFYFITHFRMADYYFS